MRITTSLLAAILLIPLTPLPLHAQAPDLLDFQARVVDSGGNLVNGSASVVLRIVTNATPTGGESILCEDSATLTLTNGLLSTQIGDNLTNPTNTVADAVQHSPLYVEMRIDGETLLPRLRVTSVAYALVAGSSGGWTDDGAVVRLATADDQVKVGVASGGSGKLYVETAANNAVYGMAANYALYGNAGDYGVYGNAANFGVFGNAGNIGVYGNAFSGNVGVYGHAWNIGVRAYATGNYGLLSTSQNDYGVYAEAYRNYGVYGNAAYYGVYGNALNYGVYGQANHNAVYGNAAYFYGVHGRAQLHGVYGRASDKFGVTGEAVNENGVLGFAQTNGVYGFAYKNYGVYGNAAEQFGVYGLANHNAVYGNAAYFYGVHGRAQLHGVYGRASDKFGVTGEAVNENGVFGFAQNRGVYGSAFNQYGVYGNAMNYGVYGNAGGQYAVVGVSAGNFGVVGNAQNVAVWGNAVTDRGVYGYAGGQYGGYFVAASGNALYCGGNMIIPTTHNIYRDTGALKAFTIDHPLDPECKVLRHFSYEGPEAGVVYRGRGVLDGDGGATVELPSYFDALSRKPHILLTPVGRHEVFVEQEVSGNTFTVGGDAGTKFFWQVTAERDDAKARLERVARPVEDVKGRAGLPARGQYISPECFEQQ